MLAIIILPSTASIFCDADVGTLQRLLGVVSAGHVAQLAYTGKDISVARAEKIGQVNDVYADAVYNAALEMASEIAVNAPLAVRGTKFMLQQGQNLSHEQSLLLSGLWTIGYQPQFQRARRSEAGLYGETHTCLQWQLSLTYLIDAMGACHGS